MRVLKWVLWIVIVLAIVFVGGAFLLPREVEVSRSIQIEATPDKVFPYVNSLKATQDWSPWLGIDPDVQLTYNDIPEGVGAEMSWVSENPQVGEGSQKIVTSVANEKVETALDFGAMGTAEARFELAAIGDGTAIIWGFKTDTGLNPIARWMGLMIKGAVAGDYDKGLANLKTLVEAES